MSIWTSSLPMERGLLGTPACEDFRPSNSGRLLWTMGEKGRVLTLLWPFSHSWWERRCYWGSALGPLSEQRA